MNSPNRLPQNAPPSTSIREINYEKKPNLFGTDGIRARVGTFPLTAPAITKLGHALGIWALNKYGAHPCMFIGHDTRESAAMIIDSLSTGLLQCPISLTNLGMLPTPAIMKLAVLDTSIDAAIIITASHNAYHDNGIKIVDGRSGKLSKDDEEKITELFYQELPLSNDPCGTMHQRDGAENDYLQAIASYFPANFLAGLKIVLDCAHGATSQVAPALFAHFGATVHVLNNEPDGRNINHHCGAVHPEQVAQAVKQEGADLGFAFDGDGDRVVAIGKNGIIKDGDDILALLLEHPAYAQEAIIVCTIMSNAGLAEFITKKNKALIRTPVGDKHVSAELKNKHLLMGGEQSGHILLADFLSSGDGIFAALRVCEVVQLTKNWNLDSFEHVAQIMINLPVTHKQDLNGPVLREIITAHQAELPNGTLIVRYSGTENLLRVMAQDKDGAHAQAVGTRLVEALKNILI